MAGPEKAQQLDQVLDADKGKEGLQLPKNFEDTFKSKENRALLVKAVNNRFENSDAIKQNKEAIIGACKTEINSWGESLPTDAGKVAVLYLYNALNGKTLYKEDVSTAFNDFKKDKTEVASIPTTGVEGKDAKKPAEILKDGVTDITENVDGKEIHFKKIVEGGLVKERSISVNLNGKLLTSLTMSEKYTNGKVDHIDLDTKINPEKFDSIGSITNTPGVTTNKIDKTSGSISVTMSSEAYGNLGNIPQSDADLREDMRNLVRFFDIVDKDPSIKVRIGNAPEAAKPTETTKPVTQTTEVTKPVTQTTEAAKTTTPEKAKSSPTLKDQVTSIPAFKDNEDVQKTLQKIEGTQKELVATKEQLKTTRETISKKTGEITNKQKELSTIDKNIVTANTIPDAIAKESALNNLTTQKEKLTGEIHTLEEQNKPLQKTERKLRDQEKFLTRQLDNRNKDLAELMEPTKNNYEKSKDSITTTINGLKGSINGNYTEEQKKLIDTEGLKTQLKQQEDVLAQLDQNLTGINTVLTSLKPTNPAPENLASKKTETKPVVATTEVKENNEQANTISGIFEFNTQEDFTKFVGKEKGVFQKEVKGILNGYDIHASSNTKEVALLQLQQGKKYLYTETKATSGNVGTQTNKFKLGKIAQEKNVNKVGSSTVFEKKLSDGRSSFITIVEIKDKPSTPAPENLASKKTETTSTAV